MNSWEKCGDGSVEKQRSPRAQRVILMFLAALSCFGFLLFGGILDTTILRRDLE